MNKYLIKKALNNNVVLVQKNNQNFVLVGKGIGFGKKRGDFLENLDNIEEKFISLKGLDDEESENFVTAIDPEIIEIMEKIIEMLKTELGEKLDSNAYVALIDHINFAIKRLKEGIEIVNPFLFEIKLMYSDEYNLAKKAVLILEENLEISIPEAEVGFLTLHIYGARKDRSKTEALEYSKLINEILELTEKKLKVKLNKNSFLCRRFVMHLMGVIDRASNGKFYENKFLDKLKDDLEHEFNIAYYIVKVIENTLKIRLPEGEIGYIALHLHKMIS